MKHVVYVECDEETLRDGGYLAHIPAVPGCVGRGLSIEEAVAHCHAHLRAYLALLLDAGASSLPQDTEDIELEVRECTSHTFDWDYSTLMPNEAEQLVQWLEVSRDELLETVAKLSPDVLDWKSKPDAWSIRNVLGHVAYCDWLYVQHLGDAPTDWNTPADWPADLFGRLAASRKFLIDSLRTVQDGARVTSQGGEDWTPRKVVRRALEHEREHLAQIREIAERYEREDLAQ